MIHTKRPCKNSDSTKPVALFITYQYCLNARNAPLYWIAREVGFRPFVVPWCYIDVRGGETFVSGGFESLANGGKRHLVCQERITPRLIFHRVKMESAQERLFSRLAQAHPDAWLSYHPELQAVGTKWGAELCFLARERRGIQVARPETFLVAKSEIATRLKAIGMRHPLIFKPAEGSQGRGIRISSPDSFDIIVQEVIKASPTRFVTQKIVENAVTLDGRRFDLRVYALVSSFRPLRFEVYRDGMAKMAAKPCDLDGRISPLSTLTNCSYRAKEGVAVENLTIPQLLDALGDRGYCVNNFWQKINSLAESVFECFASWEPLATTPELSRLFLVTGLDIILTDSSDGIKPLFIESNHSPLLFNFGPPEVDERLLFTARQWLTNLYDMCRVPAPVNYIWQPGKYCAPIRNLAVLHPVLLPEGLRQAAPDLLQSRHQARHAVGCQELAATRSEITIENAGWNSKGILLPSDHGGIDKAISLIREGLRNMRGVVLEGSTLNGVSHVVNHPEGRQKLRDQLRASWLEGNQVVIRVKEPGMSGVEITIQKRGGDVVFDFVIEADADLRSVSHPLAFVLPTVGEDDSIVETKSWPGAQFVYLAPDLVGPSLPGRCASDEEALLRYLGRVRTDEGKDDSIGRRYVEPGVGRSALVNFIRIDGRPDLNDFSVLGLGLTHYSEEGFFIKTPDIDGRCSMKKALHRQRVAEKLEEVGCRVPLTAAIISLPGVEKLWPDGKKEQAAIIVRGFRTILRVQQLDPLHGFLLSDRYRPFVAAFLLDSREQKAGGGKRQEYPQSDWRIHVELQRLSCRQKCLRYVVRGPEHGACTESNAQRRAREMRLDAIHSYAPLLLKIAKQRVARELGRESQREALNDEEYVTWFAGKLGEQLAIMKKLRFLNDYRMARDDWTFNALAESQVTLLAEFSDLDTGIFTDSTNLEGVLLTKDQFQTLHSGFSDFHAQDVEEARTIVQTLALIVYQGDTNRARQAVNHFTQVYESHVSKHQVALGYSSYSR